MANDGVIILYSTHAHTHTHTHFMIISLINPFLETYDWNKCLRFALYGSLYVAPSLYGWVKITSKIWPVTNIRTAMMKTVLEQLSYGPLATASFFFIISLMEQKTVEESKQEVIDKFWPTYKVPHSLVHYPKFATTTTTTNQNSSHFSS